MATHGDFKKICTFVQKRQGWTWFGLKYGSNEGLNIFIPCCHQTRRLTEGLQRTPPPPDCPLSAGSEDSPPRMESLARLSA